MTEGEKRRQTMLAKQRAEQALAARRGNKPDEPGLTKFLYLLGSICLVGGVLTGLNMWPDSSGPESDVQQTVALAVMGFGIFQFALLAGFGSALTYLKQITENTRQ